MEIHEDHPPFIRHSKLIQRNWGPCMECGKVRCEYYAIYRLDRGHPGMCVCRGCIPNESVEFGEEEWIFGGRE